MLLGVCTGFLVVIVVLQLLRVKGEQDSNIKRLGARAWIIPTKFLGLDNLYLFLIAGHRNQLLSFLTGLFEEHKKNGSRSYTIEATYLGGFRYIYTADPENIRTLLKDKADDFGKGTHVQTAFRGLLGDSFLFMDGEPWYQARRITRPLFVKQRYENLQWLAKCSDSLISLIHEAKGAEIGFGATMNKAFFGLNPEVFRNGRDNSQSQHDSGFIHAWQSALSFTRVLMLAGPLAAWIPKPATYKHNIRMIDDVMYPLINKVQKASSSHIQHHPEELQSPIDVITRHSRNSKDARDFTASLLFAGHESTLNALEFLLGELSRNPNAFRKLKAEITAHIGTDPNIHPTYQAMKNMKYLRYTIDETIRLYPVLPLNLREAVRDTTLPRGGGPDGTQPVGVPKGTSIGFSLFIMQRRRDLYPEISDDCSYDPALWNPDRWETWRPSTSQFVPFGTGPRSCVGQDMAYMVVGYVVCRLLQTFEAITCDCDLGGCLGGRDGRGLKTDIVLSPGETLRFRFSL